MRSRCARWYDSNTVCRPISSVALLPPNPSPSTPSPPETLDIERLGELATEIAEHLEQERLDDAGQSLAALRSADVAAVVAELPEDQLPAALNLLDDAVVAEVLGLLTTSDASAIFGALDPGRRAAVPRSANAEDAADVLHTLPWREASRTLLDLPDATAIAQLLVHRDEDAGGLMSPDYASVRDYWSVRHALRVLREAEIAPEALRQIFVVDAQDALIGRLELATLVFAPPGTRVSDIMNRDVISVSVTDDQEAAVRAMERYELVSVPVVNAADQLEGVISVSDLVNVAEQEATEDMLRIIGVTGQITARRNMWDSIKSRLPWLFLNLATVLLASFVLSAFEPTLDTLAILVVFLPVVMGQAGIAGTQTLTIIVRMLALGSRPFSVTRMMVEELLLGVVQGLIVGAVLGLIVLLWLQNPALSIVVTFSLVLNLGIAALAGVVVPAALRLVRVDPATASAVFVTTATDICGIVFYLGLATVFLTTLQ